MISTGKTFWTYPVLVLLLFALLASVGFPRPHVDDPYFAGTASWLALGHGLYNPWIVDWLAFYGTEVLFQHIPFYFYILAGWYKVAGISTASTLVFYWLVNSVTALASSRGLRWMGFPEWIVWVHLLWLIFFAQGSGFRCDMVALLFFWIGFVLLFEEQRALFFFGIVSLLIAMMVWPPVSPYSVAFGIGWLVEGGEKGQWLVRLKRCVGAGLVSALLMVFLWHSMIQGQWETFFAQYLKAAASRRPEWIMLIPTFIGLAVSRYSWCFLLACSLAFTSLLLSWYHQRNLGGNRLFLWFFCAGWGTLGLTLLYPYAIALAFYFMPLVCFAVLWATARSLPRHAVVLTGLITLLGAPQIDRFARDLASTPVNIPPGIKKSLARLGPDKRVVFDEYAYRYVFDMKPEEKSRAWFYLEPGMFAPGASYWKEGDLWLVAEPCLEGGLVDPRGKNLLIYSGPSTPPGQQK